MQHRHANHRGPHGHGRHRARRGAVGASIMVLLKEQPMHGYELMNALEERSGGRWRPSSGAIYPALSQLEGRGYVDAETLDGKKKYRLTEAGQERLGEMEGDGDFEPWNSRGEGRHGELRRVVGELTGPTRQIGRYGTEGQIAAAVAAIKEATAKLYQILADGPSDAETTETADEDVDDEQS